MAKQSDEPRGALGNGTAITVGSLVIIAGLVAAVWVVTNVVRGSAEAAVKDHCKEDVDLAHSTLSKRYVPRTEVVERLGSIEGRLERLSETIEERLPPMRRWWTTGTAPVPSLRRHQRAAGGR